MTEYDIALIEQNGACASCDKQFSNADTEPYEDRDKLQTKLRGLLCANCAIIIGMGDAVGVKSIRKVIAYLDKYWLERVIK